MAEELPRHTGPGKVPAAEAHDLAGLVDYGPGAVVSRTLRKSKIGTLTVFAFDQGQELSEHTAPFDAWVQVLEGEAELTVGGKAVPARAGQIVLMPADIPHAVRGPGRFKMLLMMFRDP
jgi:quercetin dioxygenase-like cupin family protein